MLTQVNVSTAPDRSWDHGTACEAPGKAMPAQLLGDQALVRVIAQHGGHASLKAMRSAGTYGKNEVPDQTLYAAQVRPQHSAALPSPTPPARLPGLALALILARAVLAGAPRPPVLARARARPRARTRARTCTHSCSCARQARWREKEAKYTVEKYEALPGYLDRLAAANPGSVIKLRKDADGRFSSVFVMLRGTVEAVSMCARAVTASDMGHTTNHHWHGCCAIAVTKFGSGFEVPIWFLMSVGHEDGAKWAHAAEMVALMDIAKDWYNSGITHFGDRCKGMDRFTDAWLNLVKLNCAGHILENAQEHGAKYQEYFKINHFWKLQGSASADQAARNMALFDGVPRVQAYLIAIEKKLWIWWYVAEERVVEHHLNAQ